MTFDWPLALWLAPAGAALVFGLASWARGARVGHARRWSAGLAKRAQELNRWSPIALAVAAFFGILAVAGPRWGTRLVTTDTQALNVVFGMDISRSMLAEDVEPSRLERAKREARRLVQDLGGDRMGLIGFSGRSYILSPLTIDASAIALWLDALDPSIASNGGTELSRVLQQGHDLLFATEDVADRVLVIFTDGETHDTLPDVVQAARRLAHDGIHLILVAEGGREPARIPVRDERGQLIGYQRDPSDEVVQTWRRDDVLSTIADAAQGVVVAAELDDQAGRVRDLVADYQRAPQSATTAAHDVPHAWLPLMIAIILLLVQTLTRRSLALAGLLLVVGLRPARAQGPTNPADEAWRRGAFRAAAEYYLEQARRGEGGDTTWLNLGTAALAVGDTGLTRTALGRAAASVEPVLRFRALYNLGLMELRLAQSDSARRREHLEGALDYNRQALLLEPGDRQAKWNFEVALRQLPPAPPQGGGNQPGQGEGSGGEPPPQSGLNHAQAEQLLNSIAEAERQTRRDQLRRSRSSAETRGRKEW